MCGFQTLHLIYIFKTKLDFEKFNTFTVYVALKIVLIEISARNVRSIVKYSICSNRKGFRDKANNALDDVP